MRGYNGEVSWWLFEEAFMSPIIVQIGPFAVRWYGVLIVTGVLAAAYVASIEAKRRGDNPDHVWNGLIFALIFGIIGARLYHVFSTPADGSLGWAYYKANPIAILEIWNGGLGIYGAVAGGAFGLWIYTRIAKIPFLRWTDIAAPGVLLAQAIGRWGNFFNQELYGPPSNLPWAIYIPPEKRLPGLEAYDHFHPVFLYESLLTLIGFVLFMVFVRKWAAKLKTGDVIFAYMIFYPIVRFFIEFLRPDAWKLGTLAAAQVFALIIAVVGVAGILVNHLVRRDLVEQPSLPE
jgi:phosphatidylglycerol:prolipoprotein diacylglycerol transferase